MWRHPIPTVTWASRLGLVHALAIIVGDLHGQKGSRRLLGEGSVIATDRAGENLALVVGDWMLMPRL